MTALQVIVDDSCSLHESITNGGANKFEPPAVQVLAHGIRFFCPRWDLFLVLPAVYNGFISRETPDIFAERAEFLLDGNKTFRIRDSCIYLELIADDPGIGEQPGNFFLRIPRYLFIIEIIECPAEVFSFVEDGRPAQP